MSERPDHLKTMIVIVFLFIAAAGIAWAYVAAGAP